MNEEEKKVIKQIKSELDVNEFMPRLAFECEDIETVLNLIDKQQKEINKQGKVIKEYETLLKRQEKLEQEKDILKKQGWL